MSKILLDIKIHYPTLSKAEKKVADFIVENPTKILSLYITELAQVSGASEASIVRFSKKLGFKGYQQLKIAIAKEPEARPVSTNISKSDSALGVLEKVCEDIYCSLEKTKKSIDATALQNCANALLSAKKILFFGLGNSASIAVDASHKMLRLGLNAFAYTDNHMQIISAAHTDKDSVVIGISHSGQSKDVIDAITIAQKNGATTIALTSQIKSSLSKISDIVLCTVSDETNYRILGLSSRIAGLTIIDALYSYLVCNLDNAEEHIDKTELALREKKLQLSKVSK